jgi:hypothetical protein
MDLHHFYIGCWDDEVLQQIVHYMVEGNRDIKDDLLKSMIDGKNVQYIDKRLPTYKDVSRVLSLLCLSDEETDPISFHAAVVLGKMCVADENAKNKLRKTLSATGIDTHLRALVENSIRMLWVLHSHDFRHWRFWFGK